MSTTITSPPQIVAVIGLSGAGRSTALHALEDNGYHRIDNLPPMFLERLLSEPIGARKIALGFGIEAEDDFDLLTKTLETYRARGVLEILFLDARDNVLIRRFSVTRRRQYFATDNSLEEGLRKERELISPLAEIASAHIDTSNFSPHELKAHVKQIFDLDHEKSLHVHVISFSYKIGLPLAADFVLDCRFLRNPHWDENLRAGTGRDEAVVDYIAEDPNFVAYWQDIESMISYILPAAQDEGRSYVTLAFGCTGGRHRSVAFAEKTLKKLKREGYSVSIEHRELDRRKEH